MQASSLKLSMKEFLGLVVREESVSSRKVLPVLEAKMRGRRVAKFASMFAVTAPLLLREAGMEHVRYIFRAWTAVHTFAVTDPRV